MREQDNKIIIFKTEDGKISVDTRFDEETAWLSLDQMAELFERDKSTISRHIKNVYDEGELEQSATVAKFATVQPEGARQVERQIEYYNLDMIISVGYRVKSLRGTQFRQWATKLCLTRAKRRRPSSISQMQNRKQFCTLQAEVGKCLLGQSRFTQDVLADAIEAVKGEIAQIHREQSDVTAELENQTITKENIKCYYDEFESWADEFDKATNERKRMILSKLYDHIEVRRYYDISVYLNQNHEQFLVSDVGCGAKCFLHHILTVRGVRKCRYLPKRVWFGHLKLVEQRYLPFSCK